MPEIAPGPFNERPMVLQAWGAYGTAWSVVHQQLGVDPSMGDGHLAVVPQLPPGSPRIRGDRIRVGDGTVDVGAAGGAASYRTTVTADASVDRLIVGHTLPAASDVADVTLDGRPVRFRMVMTNRGTEVTTQVPAPAGTHRLVVTAGL